MSFRDLPTTSGTANATRGRPSPAAITVRSWMRKEVIVMDAKFEDGLVAEVILLGPVGVTESSDCCDCDCDCGPDCDCC